MNFKGMGQDNINQSVNEYIRESEDLHIIGIDRGERHLLYLTLIDMKGNIKEQYSLNEIVNEYKGNTYRVDYHDLLEKREKERLEARQSWQTIENIKELKEGYLSQVIHKISQLMVKYHAIVVLEDLNTGFMRGRQKIEKQVYQKFEKMLIDKLNYLADKQKSPEELGGILNAYQLTSKFVSFQKLGKQSGFLFYTPAWNTSKIDPVTGFVNLFDTRYETREKARAFFGKFDFVRYNANKDWFEFAFDYDKFTTKAEGTRTRWTLCTQGMRIETYRDASKNSQWTSKSSDLTNLFKEFFAKHAISLDSNLKEAIANQDSKEFYEELLRLFRLTLQMRNSISNSEQDYLLSPVADENGNFFNSEEEKLKGKDEYGNWKSSLPVDADANGAYNIARKGLWMIRQIKNADNLKKMNLAISNKEWLKFVQEKPYLDD
jgi:CRISPR-associated protein Cpf1